MTVQAGSAWHCERIMSAPDCCLPAKKWHRGFGFGVLSASWYARITEKSPGQYIGDAKKVAEHAPAGSTVLEVAPGPGYLLAGLAKLGRYQATGIDISRTFVAIARKNARDAGTDTEFLLGDASAMPFCDDTFGFIICRAAFANFSGPVQALREMYRVMKPGGAALITDLRREATRESVDAEVGGLGLGWVDSQVLKWIFRYDLIPRAYTEEKIRRFLEEAGISGYEIVAGPVRYELWIRKPARA